MSSIHYRPEIDGLRAVAIIPVVLYHAGASLLPGGFVGVDVFFVISGFLITSILIKDFRGNRFSILHFYERRARRILPVFFLVVACTLLLGWLTLPPPSLEELSTSAAAATLFVSNIYFWDAVNYFSSRAEFWPLIHTWSLAVEEQFYVIFPLFLMLVLPRAGQDRTRIILLGAVVLSLALGIVGSMRSPVASFYWLPTRFWEIGLGAWLAMGGMPRPTGRRRREALAAVGTIMILTAILAYRPWIPFPGWWALLPVVGTGLVIACGGDTRVAKMLSWRPMVFVGLISYSLYLWHWPVLVYARYAFGTVKLPLPVALVCLALTIALAVMSWRYVEAPFRDRARMSRGRILSFSGAAAAVVLAVAAVGVTTDGMPQRLTERQAGIADSIRDFRGLADRCWNLSPNGGEASGLCRFGAEDAAETVLVWGDSHASALEPAWDAVLSKQGLGGVLAAHGACPPLPGIVDANAARDGLSCRDFNNRMWRWLQTGDHGIGHVILTAYWNLYITGKRMAGDAGGPVQLDYNGIRHRDSNAEAVTASLEALVSDLLDRGIAVTLVDGMPEIGWNVPVTLLFRERLGMPPPAAPSRDMVMARSALSRQTLQNIASRTSAQFVSVGDELCTPSCMTTRNGQPVYADSNHLSIFGAGDVAAPLLAERIDWK